MRFWGQKSMSTNRDQTSTNGKSKAFLTTFVWAPGSENAFSAVILASKDVFETFLGPIKACMGGHFGVILASKIDVGQSGWDHRQWMGKSIPNSICMGSKA